MSEPVRTAEQIRREFLDFFAEREHQIVPSGPVCPSDDPTLLFTNAGMNQFKDVFLGSGRRPYVRAVDTQKCIRVSGKHNDLEEVGLDTYHHTFFEMLGNWSFGDYFKREAIAWAWELLTDVWGLEKERLWVTVFGGDDKDGLPADEEAEELWKELTDIDPSHVLRFDRRDNFWEMGETGPCGPCSEIHIDRGGPGSDPTDGADPKIGVNAGNERFIELWNLVFMQFNRLDDGSLQELPARHVDTGMGFERVLSVLQRKSSNYDTDLFTPLFARLSELTGRPYGEDEEVDIAFRVIADHMRALSTALAEGALPSNEGRGYVLRRLLRRASRFGRQRLGMQEPFLFDVVPAVAEVLGPAFPEIPERVDHVQLIVRSEEESFGTTLDRGLVLFEELAASVEGSGSRTLDGRAAYDLYATYGFPQDLVEQMCRERDWTLDAAGWTAAQQEHRDASRSEGAFQQLLSAEELSGLPETRGTYHGGGPEALETTTRVAALFRGGEGRDRLVLEASPFYAESGGQVGDTGVVEAPAGGFSFRVEDTRKAGSIVVHVGTATGEAAPGLEVRAAVDSERRAATMANHTATHLLHKALREVLGDHVTQQGSYVGPDRLRFDLSHPRGIAPEEIEEIERRVNAAIARNAEVRTTVEDLAAAKARGVMALFGEKYDSEVRVVDIDGWSTELCGGTHVSAVGDIGPFLIVSERALQAGVRRLEAVTRTAAVDTIQEQRRLVTGASRALKTSPEELVGRIETLQKQLKDAKKQKEKSAKADVGSAFASLKDALTEAGGVSWAVLDLSGFDGKALKELADRAKGLAPNLALGLFGRSSGKVPFYFACAGDALAKGLKAGELAKEAAGHLGGGGGGRPDAAQGQGLKEDGVAAARAAVESSIRSALGG